MLKLSYAVYFFSEEVYKDDLEKNVDLSNTADGQVLLF